MNYLDLFAGIGGFALGAYWAGWRFDAHYFSEVDPWAVDLYRKRFPDAIPLGDIRGIDGKTLADAANKRGEIRHAERAEPDRQKQAGDAVSCSSDGDWLITGGFPCQDISFAGKGAGLQGERSGLWWEYHRLISELRPRYAIVENVRALTVRGLDVVLGSLADIGYDTEWDCIRASDVGAPHRRERIWIVAYPGSEQHEGGCAKVGWAPAEGLHETVPHTESIRVERGGSAGEQESSVSSGERVLGRDGAGQGASYWATEPNVGQRFDGLSSVLDGGR